MLPHSCLLTFTFSSHPPTPFFCFSLLSFSPFPTTHTHTYSHTSTCTPFLVFSLPCLPSGFYLQLNPIRGNICNLKHFYLFQNKKREAGLGGPTCLHACVCPCVLVLLCNAWAWGLEHFVSPAFVCSPLSVCDHIALPIYDCKWDVHTLVHAQHHCYEHDQTPGYLCWIKWVLFLVHLGYTL